LEAFFEFALDPSREVAVFLGFASPFSARFASRAALDAETMLAMWWVGGEDEVS
jgi:hypothetical protein